MSYNISFNKALCREQWGIELAEIKFSPESEMNAHKSHSNTSPKKLAID